MPLLETILIVLGIIFGVLLLIFILGALILFVFVMLIAIAVEKEIREYEMLQDIVDTREDNLDDIMRGE